MMRMALLPLAALAAACSPADDPSEGESTAAPTPDAMAGRSPSRAAASDDDGRSRYTRLTDCRLLRSAPEEAGFYEHECPGEGGYRLRLTEADLRDNVVVRGPGGREGDLALPVLADGAFSSVGETAEWRGDGAGDSFAPEALILRHTVMEDPDPAVPEVSYLVVARLGDAPCVVARIAPGPEQNRLARAAADGGGDCLGPAAG